MTAGAPWGGGEDLPLEDSLLPTAQAKAAARGEELSPEDVERARRTPRRAPYAQSLAAVAARGRAAGYSSRGYRRFGGGRLR